MWEARAAVPEAEMKEEVKAERRVIASREKTVETPLTAAAREEAILATRSTMANSTKERVAMVEGWKAAETREVVITAAAHGAAAAVAVTAASHTAVETALTATATEREMMLKAEGMEVKRERR